MTADAADVQNERLVEVLAEIETSLADNVARSKEIQRRVRRQRAQFEAGESLTTLINSESAPRTAEMLTANVETLHDVGARLRASQAAQLRAEGATLAEIADLFGVTRQRISALLRQRAASPE